ncbi:hypothetical protein TSMG0173 [Halocynthia phage JM-2012]|uniref:virion structural protein n=1 Tax=Halocynthia phage JM-2012 TaxID=1173297 RepID=UPI00025C698F|nr:virion structural protein [Halocynthia phage JM-2012]AFI55456.1 hypothetical protein TSMG0173 [Halocynthia phage JM-2012]
MAIAKLPGSPTEPEEVPVDNQVAVNTKINDLPETTTPWVDSVQGYKGNAVNYDVEGSPWRGYYYQMLRQKDDVSDVVDVLVDASYQQYTKINNYVAKLQGDLSYTITEDTKESALVGQMIIVDAIVPNKGDVWVAERGVNRIGVFLVTSTERLSGFSNAAYLIDIKLIEESDSTSRGKRLQSLEEKVVSNYHYNEKYLYLGSKPLLSTNELHQSKNRRQDGIRLAEDYMREFYRNDACTLVLDIDGTLIYDPYLTEFVTNTFPVNVSMIRAYNDEARSAETFLDNLVSKNGRLSMLIAKEMHLVSVTKVQDLQFLYGIHHTPIQYLVRPKDDVSDDTAYLGYGCFEHLTEVELRNVVPISSPMSTGTIHPVPVIGYNSSYVLSTDWYNGSTENTIFESMVTDWLEGNPLDQTKLDNVLLAYKQFTTLERFYITPVLVFLLMNNQ